MKGTEGRYKMIQTIYNDNKNGGGPFSIKGIQAAVVKDDGSFDPANSRTIETPIITLLADKAKDYKRFNFDVKLSGTGKTGNIARVNLLGHPKTT